MIIHTGAGWNNAYENNVDLLVHVKGTNTANGRYYVYCTTITPLMMGTGAKSIRKMGCVETWVKDSKTARLFLSVTTDYLTLSIRAYWSGGNFVKGDGGLWTEAQLTADSIKNYSNWSMDWIEGGTAVPTSSNVGGIYVQY